MNIKKVTLIVGIIFFGVTLSFSQSFDKKLEKTLKKIRKDNYYEGVVPFLTHSRENPEEVLKKSESLLNDSNISVRIFIIDLIDLCGQKNQKKGIKEEAVTLLIKGLFDDENQVRKKTVGKLENYELEYFSRKEIRKISKLCNDKDDKYKDILLLIGFLQMNTETKFLKSIIDNKEIDFETRWEATLALARLGDEESIKECINTIRLKGLNDRTVRFLLPDLVYIRQPRTIAYLVDMLYNDELNCSALNPDSYAKITCAYRIMEMLAPVVKNFPFRVGFDGQLRVDNYEKALIETRAWFKKNPKYQLINSTF